MYGFGLSSQGSSLVQQTPLFEPTGRRKQSCWLIHHQ